MEEKTDTAISSSSTATVATTKTQTTTTKKEEETFKLSSVAKTTSTATAATATTTATTTNTKNMTQPQDSQNVHFHKTSKSSSSTVSSSTNSNMRNDFAFPTMMKMDERTAKIIWRDAIFLVLGAIALLLVSFVETNAPYAKSRFLLSDILSGDDENNNDISSSSSSSPLGIVDTGFMLTEPLYNFLKVHRNWNDLLAAINSFALVLPSIYATYVTVWVGDYSLVFRILFVQLLRSFCGWFTYLPPDQEYLPSFYDFPDIIHCLTIHDQDYCSGEPKVLPFVSFFSGHVATMVIAGNHLWLHAGSGQRHDQTMQRLLAIVIHTLNIFQIIRLLATRGHYSIDIIIGWYMAVVVSNSAGRLGRYYSRGGIPATMQEIMPNNATEAFERVTGVTEARKEERMSLLFKNEEQIKELLSQLHIGDDDDDIDGYFGDDMYDDYYYNSSGSGSGSGASSSEDENDHNNNNSDNNSDNNHGRRHRRRNRHRQTETTLKMIHFHVETTARKLQERIQQFQKLHLEKQQKQNQSQQSKKRGKKPIPILTSSSLSSIATTATTSTSASASTTEPKEEEGEVVEVMVTDSDTKKNV